MKTEHGPMTPILGDPDFIGVRPQETGVEILTAGGDTPLREKQMAKRSHDLKGALRTMHMALESLHGGYRFDDATAGAKLAAMDRALACLKAQEPLLLAAFQAVGKTSAKSQS